MCFGLLDFVSIRNNHYEASKGKYNKSSKLFTVFLGLFRLGDKIFYVRGMWIGINLKHFSHRRMLYAACTVFDQACFRLQQYTFLKVRRNHSILLSSGPLPLPHIFIGIVNLKYFGPINLQSTQSSFGKVIGNLNNRKIIQ